MAEASTGQIQRTCHDLDILKTHWKASGNACVDKVYQNPANLSMNQCGFWSRNEHKVELLKSVLIAKLLMARRRHEQGRNLSRYQLSNQTLSAPDNRAVSFKTDHVVLTGELDRSDNGPATVPRLSVEFRKNAGAHQIAYVRISGVGKHFPRGVSRSSQWVDQLGCLDIRLVESVFIN